MDWSLNSLGLNSTAAISFILSLFLRNGCTDIEMCKLKVKALALIISASFAEIIVIGGKLINRTLDRIRNTETLTTKSF